LGTTDAGRACVERDRQIADLGVERRLPRQGVGRAAVSLARVRRDQNRRTEACDLLAPVYAWFTEGFDTADLKEAKALLDQLA